MTEIQHLLHRLLFAFEDRFDTAIVRVSDPSSQTQPLRQLPSVVPEENTSHISANVDVGSGFHHYKFWLEEITNFCLAFYFELIET